MNWKVIVATAIALAIATGCGKKDSASNPGGPGQPTTPKIAEVDSWTVANAFVKDLDKAKAEYDGKEFIVRNLLAYMSVSDKKMISSCAYDSKTRMASYSNDGRYKGQDLVKSDPFDFEVELADMSEFESIKDSADTTVDGKSFQAFETVFAVQGTIKHQGVDNAVTMLKAKLVK